MKLGFYGAAGTVTGSRFLVETDRSRVLLDCGLFQGLKELRLLNWQPSPFDPRSIDAVVLTHAHIDHSGYLPRLVKSGFNGPIYCTEPTAALLEILLLDSARLQEEDAAYANRKGFSKHHPALPLYDTRDAQQSLRLLKAVPSGGHASAAGLAVRLYEAGHILGSSFVGVDEPQTGHHFIFSGDLGRYGAPMHADPAPLPNCDTLILESTYGNRLHPNEPMEDQISKALEATLSGHGIVLIPAFAVARAQLLLLLIRRQMDAGRLPRVPVHLDSPMASDVTQLYRRYAAREGLEMERHELYGNWLTLHRTVEESMRLNNLKGPRIIIASSGMMTGGRVLHHLRRLLPDRNNLIVLAGYQAAGTRGRKLADGARYIRVYGGDVPVRARLVQIEGLSAHADADDLVHWVGTADRPPRTTFLVHGEPPAADALSTRLRDAGLHTIVPGLNQRFEIAESGHWQEDRGS
ncbi:MAG TPA: MBL fold metallo-hydrolase [Dehalococcoidia bacterium]|nr:MBL fold metallo-hydrolase [Dehalococcoidia bacterium]